MAALIPDERWFILHFFFLQIKTQQAISGTSGATYKVMEPHYDQSPKDLLHFKVWPVVVEQRGLTAPPGILGSCWVDADGDKWTNDNSTEISNKSLDDGWLRQTFRNPISNFLVGKDDDMALKIFGQVMPDSLENPTQPNLTGANLGAIRS